MEFVAGRRRIHRQSGAGHPRDAAAWHCRRPRAGLLWRGIVGHGAERLTLARQAADKSLSHPSPPPRGQPWTGRRSAFAWRRQNRGLYCGTTGAVRAELGSAVQIRPGRRRRVDIYPRAVANLRMGRRGGHAVVAAGPAASHGFQMARRALARTKDFIIPEFIGLGDPKAQADYCARPCSSAGQRAVASLRKRVGLAANDRDYPRAEQIEPIACDHPEARLPA